MTIVKQSGLVTIYEYMWNHNLYAFSLGSYFFFIANYIPSRVFKGFEQLSSSICSIFFRVRV